MSEPLAGQIERLANFILANVPGEPSEDEGAVDTAIRLLGDLVEAEKVIEEDGVEMEDLRQQVAGLQAALVNMRRERDAACDVLDGALT